MKFVIYNVENCRTRENRVGKRSIRFNSVTGNMYLSTKLVIFNHCRWGVV